MSACAWTEKEKRKGIRWKEREKKRKGTLLYDFSHVNLLPKF